MHRYSRCLAPAQGNKLPLAVGSNASIALKYVRVEHGKQAARQHDEEYDPAPIGPRAADLLIEAVAIIGLHERLLIAIPASTRAPRSRGESPLNRAHVA